MDVPREYLDDNTVDYHYQDKSTGDFKSFFEFLLLIILFVGSENKFKYKFCTIDEIVIS